MPTPASIIPVVPVNTQYFEDGEHTINRTWILFFEALIHPPDKYQALDYKTFGLGIGGAQAVGNDLTTHGQAVSAGELLAAMVNAKTPPATLPLYLDIMRSGDQGAHWVSIFPNPGVADSAKLVLPAGATTRAVRNTFVRDPYLVLVGDWWRIDLLAGSGEDAQDINVVLVWGVPSITQSVADIQGL